MSGALRNVAARAARRAGLAARVAASTLATAESLTGGRLAARHRGPRRLGGLRRGSGRLRHRGEAGPARGARRSVVERHGVVSPECARRWPRASRLLAGDVRVSTTGVAGPDAQEGKPVGTVFVGIAGPDGCDARGRAGAERRPESDPGPHLRGGAAGRVGRSSGRKNQGSGSVGPTDCFEATERGRAHGAVPPSLGDVLRNKRLQRGMTLREVSAEARVCLGYISEIERGQKEASSELLASLCAALDVPLSDVLRDVSTPSRSRKPRLSSTSRAVRVRPARSSPPPPDRSTAPAGSAGTSTPLARGRAAQLGVAIGVPQRGHGSRLP